MRASLQRVGLAIAFLLAGTAACSSSDDGPAAVAPAPPDPVAPLACAAGETEEGGACVTAGLLACPAGTSGAEGVCAPTFPATCAAGTARFLGDTSCTAVGHTTCPAGTTKDPSGWGCTATLPATCTGGTRAAPGGACVAIGTCPSVLPAGAVRLVDASFGAGQLDATHFATIGAALAGAPAGTVLSVAPGTYHENLDVPAGVAVVGTCASDVVIEPVAGATAAAVAASSGAVTLRGLTLRGAPIGLSVKGATVTADALVIEQCHGEGVNVQSGALALKSSVVRGTVADPPVRDDGTGIFGAGGTTTLDDVTIDGSTGTGLAAWRTSKVVAHGLTVVRTAKSASGLFGWGIDVESGGSFDGTRVVVAASSFAGIAATDKGSSVTLTDAIVSDVALGTFGSGGPSLAAGLAISSDAAVTMHHVSLGKTGGCSMLVAGNGSLVGDGVTARDGGVLGDAIGGLYASTAKVKLTSSVVVGAVHNGIESLDGAAVTVDGLLVRDTKSTADSSSGIGALTSRKGTLDGKRLTLEGNVTAQLAVLEGSTVTLESFATLDAKTGSSDTVAGTGIGVLADQGSKISLTNAYLGQNKLIGISLRRTASLEAKGLVIDGVALTAGGDSAYGVLAIEGTSVTLTDFTIRGAHGASLVIGEANTKAKLTRGTLRDAGIDKTLTVGRGASIQAGAAVSFDRVRIQGSKGTAMYITTAANVSLAACVVDGVTTAGNGKFGDAFEVVEDSVLRVDRSVIRGAVGAALVFAGGAGAVDGSLIEGNAVGIHVQGGSELTEAAGVPADLQRHSVVVSTSTQFLDNQTRLGSGVVPLPQPLSL